MPTTSTTTATVVMDNHEISYFDYTDLLPRQNSDGNDTDTNGEEWWYDEQEQEHGNRTRNILPGELGMLLPVLDVHNAYVVHPNNNTNNNTRILCEGYNNDATGSNNNEFGYFMGGGSEATSTAPFTNSARSSMWSSGDEEKVNEEDLMIHSRSNTTAHATDSNNTISTNSANSNTRRSANESSDAAELLQKDHGPLYEDDEEDFEVICVGVKRTPKRYYAVGKTQRELVMDSILQQQYRQQQKLNHYDVISFRRSYRMCPPETVMDLNKLCPKVKRLKRSKRINPDTLEEEDNSSDDEESHLDDDDRDENEQYQQYQQMMNIKFLQAQFIFENGVVTSRIVEKPDLKSLYQHRFGKARYVYRVYKSRIYFAMFCIGVVLIGLAASGNLVNEEGASISKSISDQDLYMPTTFPSSQPSSLYEQLLSEVAVTQRMTRTNNSNVLSSEEMTDFERAMVMSMTNNGTGSAILNNPVIASRLNTHCQIIEQYVEKIDDTSALGSQNETLVEQDTRRSLEDVASSEVYMLTLDYTISWTSNYRYWEETSNMTYAVEQYLVSMVNGTGMAEVLNSSGVEVDENGISILSVVGIPLASSQPSLQPTFGKLEYYKSLLIVLVCKLIF